MTAGAHMMALAVPGVSLMAPEIGQMSQMNPAAEGQPGTNTTTSLHGLLSESHILQVALPGRETGLTLTTVWQVLCR